MLAEKEQQKRDKYAEENEVDVGVLQTLDEPAQQDISKQVCINTPEPSKHQMHVAAILRQMCEGLLTQAYMLNLGKQNLLEPLHVRPLAFQGVALVRTRVH